MVRTAKYSLTVAYSTALAVYLSREDDSPYVKSVGFRTQKISLIIDVFDRS